MPPRLSDIAAALGLNIATVSRALRDDPRIKVETRARIKAEAERLGYRPHWGARALAEGRSRTIWMLTGGLDSPIERDPALWAGRWLLERGYDLLLAQFHGDATVYARLLDRLAHGGADGAIIIPRASASGAGDVDQLLVSRGLPLVYLDRNVPGINVPVVTTDNRQAAAELVGQMVEAARKKGQPLEWLVDGFDPGLNSVEAERSRGVHDAARRWGLALGQPRSGSGGYLASNAVDWLKMSIPRPSSVGVFDAWNVERNGLVNLFVARQDFRTLGEQAARTLLHWVTEGEKLSSVKVPILDFVPN